MTGVVHRLFRHHPQIDTAPTQTTTQTSIQHIAIRTEVSSIPIADSSYLSASNGQNLTHQPPLSALPHEPLGASLSPKTHQEASVLPQTIDEQDSTTSTSNASPNPPSERSTPQASRASMESCASTPSESDNALRHVFHTLRHFARRHKAFFFCVRAIADLCTVIGSLCFIVGAAIVIAMEDSETVQKVGSAIFIVGSSCFFLSNILRLINQLCHGIVSELILSDGLTITRTIAAIIAFCSSIGYFSGSTLLFVTTMNIMEWDEVRVSESSSWLYFVGSIGFMAGIFVDGVATSVELFQISVNDSLELRIRQWTSYTGAFLYWNGSVFFLLGSIVLLFFKGRSWEQFALALWLVGSLGFFCGPFVHAISDFHMFAFFNRMRTKSLLSLHKGNPVPDAFKSSRTENSPLSPTVLPQGVMPPISTGVNYRPTLYPYRHRLDLSREV